MNVEYRDERPKEQYKDLTDEEIWAILREKLGDPLLKKITIKPDGPNRKERRRQAALDRKNK